MSSVYTILCHCGGDADGHVPGADECSEVPIKAGHYCRPWPESAVSEYGRPATAHLVAARGTCPVCGKRVKVVRIETHGTWGQACPRLPGESKAADERRRVAKFGKAGTRGPLLQVQPGIGPHKHSGRDCPGAGQVPAETRYTPGRELASWIHVHGDESVA